MCVSTSVGIKFQVLITSKSKTQRCFRISQSPARYFNQSNAWSEGPTLWRWFFVVYIPFFRCIISRNVALLMDRFSPNGGDLLKTRYHISISPYHQTVPLSINLCLWVLSKVGKSNTIEWWSAKFYVTLSPDKKEGVMVQPLDPQWGELQNYMIHTCRSC